MNRFKIYIGILAITISIGLVLSHSIAAAYTLPEYYVDNSGSCKESPAPSICSEGPNPCLRIIPGQGTAPRQIYDAFLTTNSCANPLSIP